MVIRQIYIFEMVIGIIVLSLQAAQRQIRQLVNRSQLTNLRRPPPPGGLPPNQRQVQAN